MFIRFLFAMMLLVATPQMAFANGSASTTPPPIPNNGACNSISPFSDTSFTQDAATIMKNAQAISTNISKGWDCQWENLISGPQAGNGVYGSMSLIGQLFAVATLVFFLFEWVRDMNEGRDGAMAAASLMWPLVVAVLLSNKGAVLGDVSAGIRQIAIGVNKTFLTQTSNGIQLQQAYQYALAYTGTTASIQNIAARCANIADNKQQAVCMYGQDGTAENPLPGSMQYDINQAVKLSENAPWGVQLGNYAKSIVQGFTQGFTGSGAAGGVAGAWNSFMRPIDTANVFITSVAHQMAFSNAIEVAMLVTAFLGPLAVGGSLLPFASKSVYAWLSAMFSLGFGKLIFNAIIAISASTIVNAGGADSLWFSSMMADIAPWMTAALVGGGGWAAFSVTSNWVSKQVDGAASSVVNTVKFISQFL